ncbi:hypothetical protein HOD08_03940 [bacterium]|nr:hypothetical protein [bacterium]
MKFVKIFAAALCVAATMSAKHGVTKLEIEQAKKDVVEFCSQRVPGLLNTNYENLKVDIFAEVRNVFEYPSRYSSKELNRLWKFLHLIGCICDHLILPCCGNKSRVMPDFIFEYEKEDFWQKCERVPVFWGCLKKFSERFLVGNRHSARLFCKVYSPLRCFRNLSPIKKHRYKLKNDYRITQCCGLNFNDLKVVRGLADTFLLFSFNDVDVGDFVEKIDCDELQQRNNGLDSAILKNLVLIKRGLEEVREKNHMMGAYGLLDRLDFQVKEVVEDISKLKDQFKGGGGEAHCRAGCAISLTSSMIRAIELCGIQRAASGATMRGLTLNIICMECERFGEILRRNDNIKFVHCVCKSTDWSSLIYVIGNNFHLSEYLHGVQSREPISHDDDGGKFVPVVGIPILE